MFLACDLLPKSSVLLRPHVGVSDVYELLMVPTKISSLNSLDGLIEITVHQRGKIIQYFTQKKQN